MIGLMNIPENQPTEFYAACPRLISTVEDSAASIPELDISMELKGQMRVKRPQRLVSIFGYKKNSDVSVSYLRDGRKIVTGNEKEKSSAPKLWEQLIIRSFLHKIQDEITCPIEQMNVVEKHFQNYTLSPNGRSNSTFSLVSEDRILSTCSKCNNTDDDITEKSYEEGVSKQNK